MPLFLMNQIVPWVTPYCPASLYSFTPFDKAARISVACSSVSFVVLFLREFSVRVIYRQFDGS